MTLIKQAHDIFNRAYDEHQPSHVFILTSGGNDSIVPLHLFRKDSRITAAVHIDTGVKAPEVEPHVRATCEAFGLRLLIYRALENTKADGTPDPQDYDQIVIKHGFPGPAQHTIIYAKLKQRQVDRLIRDHKQSASDRILLITGVRKAESTRRMGHVQEQMREGTRVWIAPVMDWSDEDMAVYRAHHQLPKNPASEKLGMSGECLCGAFAKPGELNRIRQHYPDIAERFDRLQRDSGCLWAWDERPGRDWIELNRGQGTLGITPLCTSCLYRGRA